MWATCWSTREYTASRPSLDSDEAGAAQHPQVLRDQWLAHTQQVDQLMHEARPVCQLGDDGQPGGRGQYLQQLAGRLEHLRLR